MKYMPDFSLLLKQANFNAIDKALLDFDSDDKMVCIFKDAYKVVRKYVTTEETECTHCIARKKTAHCIGIYYESKSQPCYTSLDALLFKGFYDIIKDTDLLSQEDEISITKALLMDYFICLGFDEIGNGVTVSDKLKSRLGKLSLENECKLYVGLLQIRDGESTYLQVIETDSEFFILAPDYAFAVEAFSCDVTCTCRVSRNNALMRIVVTGIKGHEYYLFNNKLIAVSDAPERYIRMGKDIQRKAIMLRGYPR